LHSVFIVSDKPELDVSIIVIIERHRYFGVLVFINWSWSLWFNVTVNFVWELTFVRFNVL